MPVIWSLDVTISMRYDEHGEVIACGVETPNHQGWHPRVDPSYMTLATPLFPQKLPRAAMRLAKAAAKRKRADVGNGHAGDLGTQAPRIGVDGIVRSPADSSSTAGITEREA